MCNFQCNLVYKEAALKLVDYAWRLDDDSRIRGPVPMDLFQFMRDNNVDYGYNKILGDSARCVYNLWETVTTYIRMKNITTQYFNTWKENMVYYNNFELSKVSFWFSAEYQDYIEYILQAGGIYKYRWGDAPIKTLALTLFMQKNKTYDFKDIPYDHI